MDNCTQILDESFFNKVDVPDVGRLKVGSLAINGVLHDIFRGDNVIGRDELSDIVIRSGAISSRHAVIEVEDYDAPLLYDCGSTNKTRLGKMMLKPQVRYMLKGDDEIMFADIKAKYAKHAIPQRASITDEDSGSETGSESMLNMDSVNLEDEPDKSRDLLMGSVPFKIESSTSNINTSSELNDSSVYEEKKEVTNSNIGVVEASIDESTDEEDCFIPPSQTVKEFKSKKREDKLSSRNLVSTNFTQDIFGMETQQPNIVATSNFENNSGPENIFEMETQRPNIVAPFNVETKFSNERHIIPDTQSVFDADSQYPVKEHVANVSNDSIFELETEDVGFDQLEGEKKVTEKQMSRISADVFNDESDLACEIRQNQQESNFKKTKGDKIDITKMDIGNAPNRNGNVNELDSKDDLEMSELVLSRALTEVNTSSQVAIPSQKNVNDISEECTQLNTFSKHKELKTNSRNLENIVSVELEKITTNCDTNGKHFTCLEKHNTKSKTIELESQLENDLTILNSNLCATKHNENKIALKENKEIDETESNICDELTQVNPKLYVNNYVHNATQKHNAALTQINVQLNLDTSNINKNIDQNIVTCENYEPDVTPKNNESNTARSLPPSPNALTEVNFQLGDNLFKERVMSRENCLNKNNLEDDKIEDDAIICEQMENLAAQETQLNIHLLNKKCHQKVVQNIQNTPKYVSDIETNETQPNLNLDSFFRGQGINVDISELETQPYISHKLKPNEDSDSTDVEDDVSVKKVNITSLKNEIPKNYTNVKNNNNLVSNKFEFDGSSNDSDSLLATMPLDNDLEASELNQSYIKETQKEQISDENICSIKKEDKLFTDKHTVSDKETSVKSILAVADMSLCSTVGMGPHVSVLSLCDSAQKANPFDSEVGSTSSQSSSKFNTGNKLLLKSSNKKVLDHMSPILEENLKTKQLKPKTLFVDNQHSDSTINQYNCLLDPCSSSTPFRIENKPNFSEFNKTPPKKLPGVYEEFSPLLPSTEELIQVADKTPECNYKSPSKSVGKQKEKLPLALQRTPRVKRLSRKMVESLEKEDTLSESKKSTNESKEELPLLGQDPTKHILNELETCNVPMSNNNEKNQTNENVISGYCKIKNLSVCLKNINTAMQSIEVKSTNKKTNNTLDIKMSKTSSKNTTHNTDTVDPESEIPTRRTRTAVLKNNIDISPNQLIKKSETNLPNKISPIKKSGRLKKEKSSEVHDENMLHYSESCNKNNCTRKTRKCQKIMINVGNEPPSKTPERSKVGISFNDNKPQLKLKKELQNGSPERSPVKKTKIIIEANPIEEDIGKSEKDNLSSKNNVTQRTAKYQKNQSKNRDESHTKIKERNSAVSSNHIIEPNIVIPSNERSAIKKNEKIKTHLIEAYEEKNKIHGRNNKGDTLRKTESKHVTLENSDSKSQVNLLKSFENDSNEKRPSRRNGKSKKDQVSDKEVKMHVMEGCIIKGSSSSEIKTKRKLKDCSGEESKAKIIKMPHDNKNKTNYDVDNKMVSDHLLSNNSIKDPSIDLDIKIKRKLNDNLVESSKSVKLSNDDKSNNKSNLKPVETKLKKECRSAFNRTRMKPARFRDDQTAYDSSTSERSSSSKRSKASDIYDSMESIESLPSGNVRVNKINTSEFTVPVSANSKSKNTIMEKRNSSQNFKENNRIRSKKKQQNTTAAITESLDHSRSSSMSSLESLNNDTALVQSPRRSIKTGVKVLFTGLSNPTMESHIKKLGGVVVDNPSDCTVLITDKVRRTVKFLCALAQGKPIVTPDWVVRSWQCTKFEDPMSHLLRDTESEQRFKFHLANTLRLARVAPLLQGYTVYATRSVKPPLDDIKSIVVSAGGEFLEKVPSRWPPQTFVISHPDDQGLWKKLTVRGVSPTIVQAEMLLLGILQHSVDLKTHIIS